jgi:hypothetical protein
METATPFAMFIRSVTLMALLPPHFEHQNYNNGSVESLEDRNSIYLYGVKKGSTETRHFKELAS